MTTFTYSVVIILILIAFVPPAGAADFGVRAGRYNDGQNNFVGAELVWNVGRIAVNPNIEYITNTDLDTAGTANLDVAINLTRGRR